MNVILVDTSSWISYFNGKYEKEKEIDLALKEGRIYLSPVVAAELLSSHLNAKERQRLIHFLSNLPLCDSSLEHWFRVGELRSQLLRSGFTVSTPDTHIAQCSLDLEGYLLTEDKIFKEIAKIKPLRLL